MHAQGNLFLRFRQLYGHGCFPPLVGLGGFGVRMTTLHRLVLTHLPIRLAFAALALSLKLFRRIQRHAARHTQRLARRSGRRSERPVGRMPTACHRWAETMAPLACCIPLLLVSRDGVGPSPRPSGMRPHTGGVWLSSVAEVAAFFVPALAHGAASPLDIWPLRVDTKTTLENRVKNDYIFSSLAMSKDFSLPMEFSGRVAL
jgi:hypothetical protein